MLYRRGFHSHSCQCSTSSKIAALEAKLKRMNEEDPFSGAATSKKRKLTTTHYIRHPPKGRSTGASKRNLIYRPSRQIHRKTNISNWSNILVWLPHHTFPWQLFQSLYEYSIAFMNQFPIYIYPPPSLPPSLPPHFFCKPIWCDTRWKDACGLQVQKIFMP